ncbi:MAG: hypothetical protein WA231_19000 [Methylocella sp.]
MVIDLCPDLIALVAGLQPNPDQVLIEILLFARSGSSALIA